MYPVTDEYLAAQRAPFREERITGAIRLKDGTKIVVDNSSIAQGTLSMTRQAFKSDKFDIGMLSCAVLNIRLKDERAYDHEFSGALVRLKYGIVTATAEDGTKTWYDVPLPPFYVNGHGTRQRNFIKLTAYDPVRLLSAVLPADVPTTSLYAALQYICAMCGIAIGTSEAEFNALPNSGIIPDFTSESIETCADAVMWIAQTVNCCAFCDYHGWLVFRQYRYDGGNTYDYLFTAARRAKIEYSDTRTYLAYLQSYVRNDVKTYSNIITWTGTDAPHIKEGSMLLPKNPILKNLTADQQETVNKSYLLFANRGHSTRYVKSTGFVDPVLEPFDVAAFSGGSIDIGQIISVATKIVWKFRGNGTVYCTNVSENGEVASSTSEQSGDDEVSAYSVEEGAVPVRANPKSQLEKRMDELEAGASGADAEKLISPDKKSHAAVTNDNALRLYKDGLMWGYLVPLRGGFQLGCAGPMQLEMPGDQNSVALYNMNNGVWLAGNEADIKLSGNNSYIYVNGAIVQIANGGLTILGSGSALKLSKTSGGWRIEANNHSLEASADGLYYDGSKIG